MTTFICVSMLLSFGFILGIAYSAWVMATKAQKAQNAVFKSFGENEESARLTSKYSTAVALAARCWCDPRTCGIEMDTDLSIVFAETIGEYIDALQWCGGAADFQRGGDGVPEGIACEGFDRICRPLMSANGLIDVSCLSIKSYKRLQKNGTRTFGTWERS